MTKLAALTPPIDLDSIGVTPSKDQNLHSDGDRSASLDRILQNQERSEQGQFLLEREFLLKEKQIIQTLELQKTEFRWVLRAKIVLFVFVVALVFGIAYKLYCLFGKASASDLMLFDKSHVLLAIVAGSFLTVFGLLASLLKGLGQKEKPDTPIAIEEVLKALISTFKNSK